MDDKQLDLISSEEMNNEIEKTIQENDEVQIESTNSTNLDDTNVSQDNENTQIESNIEEIFKPKGRTFEMALKIQTEMNKSVLNYQKNTNLALCVLFSGGHVLLEGVPGVAKTLWVRSLSKALNLEFKRTQFTPDLMPADITGTKIFNLQANEFELKKGPLFTNLYLADEINRTPPKTQAALLEVMEEKSITLDGETHILADPFFVVATQNPIEFEGTYGLPEALTDRFMMKLIITYPGTMAEKQMLLKYNLGFDAKNLKTAGINEVCSAEDFRLCKEEIEKVRIEESIINYILNIIETTRRLPQIAHGASPRASVAMLLCSKAYAAINGRDYVIPEDIAHIAIPLLRHRIILKPEFEIEGVKIDDVLQNIIQNISVPR